MMGVQLLNVLPLGGALLNDLDLMQFYLIKEHNVI